MNETDFDSTAPLDKQASERADQGARYGFGYCGGCGSWDAHGLECVSCGYDFQSSRDDPTKADRRSNA